MWRSQGLPAPLPWGDGRWVVWLHLSHPAGGGEQVASTGRAWELGPYGGQAGLRDTAVGVTPHLGPGHRWEPSPHGPRGAGRSEQATRGEESVGDRLAFRGGAWSSCSDGSAWAPARGTSFLPPAVLVGADSCGFTVAWVLGSVLSSPSLVVLGFRPLVHRSHPPSPALQAGSVPHLQGSLRTT